MQNKLEKHKPIMKNNIKCKDNVLKQLFETSADNVHVIKHCFKHDV